MQIKLEVRDETTHINSIFTSVYLNQCYKSNWLACPKPLLLQTTLLARTAKSTTKLIYVKDLNSSSLSDLHLFLLPHKYLVFFQALMFIGIFLLGMQACSCSQGWLSWISITTNFSKRTKKFQLPSKARPNITWCVCYVHYDWKTKRDGIVNFLNCRTGSQFLFC